VGRGALGVLLGISRNFQGLAITGLLLAALVSSSLLTLNLVRIWQSGVGSDASRLAVSAVWAETNRLQGLILSAGNRLGKTSNSGYGETNFPLTDLATTLTRVRNLLQVEALRSLLPVLAQLGGELAFLDDLVVHGGANGGQEGPNGAEPVAVGDGGRVSATQLRIEALNHLLLELNKGLQARLDTERSQQGAVHFAKILMVNLLVGIVGSILGLIGIVIFFFRTRYQHGRQLGQGLGSQLDELTKRNRQLNLLNELSTTLLRCGHLDETFFEAVRTKVGALLPDETGALFLYRSDHSGYEFGTVWGTADRTSSLGTSTSATRTCPTTPIHLDAFDLHYQLAAQGQPLGVLAMMKAGDTVSIGAEQLYSAVADVVSLAIANLQLRASLEEQAVRDPLTDLYNRRHFERTLKDEIRHAGRTGQALSLITADIDHFKSFNDRLGHEAGDQVLKALGRLMKLTFRVRDVPCRYGGEEFLILLPETNLVSAAIRAERLAEQVRHVHIGLTSGSLEKLTISVGVATYPEHGEVAQELLRRADEALYQAKEFGRNRVVLAR
jgi:diguanylate cyclase (GGDEF)-like protein